MLRGLLLTLIASVMVAQLLSACSSRQTASRGAQYEVDSCGYRQTLA